MYTTKIIKEISYNEFKEIISKYKEDITVSLHALDHLSDSQRKIFNKKDLIDPLIKEKPKGIGLQQNSRYAAFFKRKDYYLRIIFEIKGSKLEIITFLNTDYLTNLKRL